MLRWYPSVSQRRGGACPDSEVRAILRLRTSESKDTLGISCGFGPEVRIADSPRNHAGF
jgi:hypothetical protein